MHLSGFDQFAWVAASIGQVVLLFILWRRGRAQIFPFFTLFLAQEAAASVILYLIHAHYSTWTYAYSYWAEGFVDEILQLLVVYEIARHVFRPTGVWARDVRPTVVGISCVSILVAFLLSLTDHPVTKTRIVAFVMRTDFFSSALMSELFVGMVVLSITVGLPWKTHVARIAQGLGAFCLVSVGIDILEGFVGIRRGSHAYAALSHAVICTYIACEAYWSVMLWAEAPAPRQLPPAMRIQIYTLQRQVENDLRRIRAWRPN